MGALKKEIPKKHHCVTWRSRVCCIYYQTFKNNFIYLPIKKIELRKMQNLHLN